VALPLLYYRHTIVTACQRCGAVPTQGFHRVEYLLFRERNLTAAEWWAAALVNSSIALSADLLGRCRL
jgi:hypothetical protein